MKNVLLSISLLIATSVLGQAPLEKNNIQLNVGFGASSWGNPIYFGADYGLDNNFTIGVQASYQSYKTFGITSTILGIQGNGNYHFNELLKIPSKWDVYAGLNLNYYSWKIKDDNSYFVDDEPFGVGGQIGGRYFFNDQFAVNMELDGGNATSGLKIGVTYKL